MTYESSKRQPRARWLRLISVNWYNPILKLRLRYLGIDIGGLALTWQDDIRLLESCVLVKEFHTMSGSLPAMTLGR
jgi:hypothetical protein